MPTATTGEARVEIDAAPLTVYELISDITRMGDWSPECYRCEWLNGATAAEEGARFRGHNRLGKVRWHTDAIVTVADPGRNLRSLPCTRRAGKKRCGATNFGTSVPAPR